MLRIQKNFKKNLLYIKELKKCKGLCQRLYMFIVKKLMFECMSMMVCSVDLIVGFLNIVMKKNGSIEK